jgi:hypothetical protein
MPKILLGISMLLMGFAALFGFLNANKVKTLRTELGVVRAARDAAVRQTVVKETALKNGSSGNTKLSSAEAKAATAEADLAKSRTEKADLEMKLKASQTENTALQKRVTEVTTGATSAGSSGADLKAQLEDAKKQLDAAEQEKSLLTDKMKSAGNRVAPLQEKRRRTSSGDKPGVHGSVLAVNQAYNFVVLSLGERQGVVANSSMLVRRRGALIGKIRISSVEPTTAIGDIITNTLGRGVQVQPGDTVIYADTTSP